jgi:hypothetical protein
MQEKTAPPNRAASVNPAVNGQNASVLNALIARGKNPGIFAAAAKFLWTAAETLDILNTVARIVLATYISGSSGEKNVSVPDGSSEGSGRNDQNVGRSTG